MAMKELVVEIGPDGKVKMEAFGFEGSACELEAAALQQALGDAERHELKPEYHSRRGSVQEGRTVKR